MVGSEGNPQPIQLVVNYWERRPRMMRAKLDELARQGVKQITSFIPWQAFESDISHTLSRFLQAVSDKKMTVSLIATPEVGVHFPYSGFPKDIFNKKENIALHEHGSSVFLSLAPNAFALPSLLSPIVERRYASFLNKLDNFLADLGRTQPEAMKCVRLVVTGSVWKYYRSPKTFSASAFASAAGDFSGASNLVFRQKMEERFMQPEFAYPNPAAANRWKTRNLEGTNRRWFFQQAEENFRAKTLQQLRRKSSYVPFSEVELYTPEADPALFYSNVMQMLSGGNSDFQALSGLIDDFGSRMSMGVRGKIAPAIHWSALGGFQRLSDSERQFLVLKSLLVMGGQGGSIYLNSEDWLSFSFGFRSRVEALARTLGAGDLRIRTRAVYLTPHLWSAGNTLWSDLREKLGWSVRMVSSVDLVLRESSAEILVVDPQFIFTRESLLKILAWTRPGRTLVIPRSALYTEAARDELESVLSATPRIEMALGLSFRLHAFGEGKLFFCDYSEASLNEQNTSSWNAFIAAVLSVSRVQGYCRVSDARLSTIALERKGGQLGLFVMNETRDKVAGDVLFQQPVQVSDLSIALSAREDEVSGSEASPRLSLEVPPCGIFPLAIHGQVFSDLEERDLASEISSEPELIAREAGSAELPGMEESVWN